MKVTETFKPNNRQDWRNWLTLNHAIAGEIWLLFDDRADVQTISYLDAVEEALCFGWIDGIQKRHHASERAQRFTPRRKKSNWTELNKERARRLIRLGFMTEAGMATLPDLQAQPSVPVDIIQALQAEPDAWVHFQTFPDLYRRVRIGYIVEARNKPDEFARRLNSFVKRTAANQLFGNWNDGGRLL